MKEKYDKTDRYLRDAEDELERVKKKMNKYKEMCEQKELKEREDLTKKLTKTEIELEEKSLKVKVLELFTLNICIKINDIEVNKNGFAVEAPQNKLL